MIASGARAAAVVERTPRVTGASSAMMNKAKKQLTAEELLFTQSLEFRSIGFHRQVTAEIELASMPARHDLLSDSTLTSFGWNRPKIDRATIDALNFVGLPITHIEGMRDYSRTWLELA